MSVRLASVIDDMGKALSRDGGMFLVIAVVINGIPLFLMGLLPLVLSQDQATSVMVTAPQGIVTLVSAVLAQGAIIHGTLAGIEGRPARFGDCLAASLKHLLPLLGIAILSYIGFVLGFILFIIPGLILITMWAVTLPVQMAENTGVFGAFGRSRRLTHGSRLKILLVIVIYIAIIMAITFGLIFATGGLSQMTDGRMSIFEVSMSAILGAISIVIASTFLTALYARLRAREMAAGTPAPQAAA